MAILKPLCVQCGGPTIPQRGAKSGWVCSDECRLLHAKERDSRYIRIRKPLTEAQKELRRQRGREAHQERYVPRAKEVSSVCIQCGEPFTYDRGTERKRRRLCSPACQEARARPQTNASKRKYWRLNGATKLKHWDKRCLVCDNPFSTYNNKTAHCGTKCANVTIRTSVLRWINENPQARIWASRAEKDRHYCHVRRVRLANAAPPVAERFTSQEIFARDGWRCQICHKKVDRRLKHPDPGSASLDHITPISLGGSHTRVNVQCAHFGCNVAKHNRGVGDQMRLLG